MWQDSYAIGVDIIDAQHKGLFEYVGRLFESLGLETNFSHRKEEIDEAIGILKYYAVEHFATEEEYALSVGYSGYETHKAKHELLKHEVLDFEKQLVQSNYDSHVIKKFLGFVLSWLIFHVVQEDRDIAKDQQRRKASLGGEYIGRYAQRVKEVLIVFSGIPDGEISIVQNVETPIDFGVCYMVNLVGGIEGKQIGVIFSEGFADGMLKTMTGEDLKLYEASKATLSIFDGMLNNVVGKIAESMAEEGAAYGISAPAMVSLENIPHNSNYFMLSTQMGDVGVVMY